MVDLGAALHTSYWSGSVTNDFEGPIFQKYPVIAGVKNTLLDAGAKYASMSGSGSSVYGFFDEEPLGSEHWFGSEYMVWRQKL